MTKEVHLKSIKVGTIRPKNPVNNRYGQLIILPCAVVLLLLCNKVMIAEQLTQTVADTVKIERPIIGILAEVLRDYKRFVEQRHDHIVASYVKWAEMAGAQVLPIMLNQNDSYYEQVFRKTNGLIFPGGDNLLDPHKNTPMLVAARKLYKLAIEANDKGDFYPMWGTCLGKLKASNSAFSTTI